MVFQIICILGVGTLIMGVRALGRIAGALEDLVETQQREAESDTDVSSQLQSRLLAELRQPIPSRRFPGR